MEKQKSITKIIEETAEEMCNNYCKWPEQWDEEEEGFELCESEICKKLPVQQTGAELTRLRGRIKERYGSVYRFAPAVGFTQSMLSRMLHGRRKIYPDSRKRMGELLEIPESEHTKYFGR